MSSREAACLNIAAAIGDITIAIKLTTKPQLMKQKIIDAINNRNLLAFMYNGHYRIAEPHTFGVSGKGNNSLSAYQVHGSSDKGIVPDWKLFTIEKISGLEILEEVFSGTRPGYRRRDSRMVRIYAEL